MYFFTTLRLCHQDQFQFYSLKTPSPPYLPVEIYKTSVV